MLFVVDEMTSEALAICLPLELEFFLTSSGGGASVALEHWSSAVLGRRCRGCGFDRLRRGRSPQQMGRAWPRFSD